jgi:2,3-dimethylmalate lyase
MSAPVPPADALTTVLRMGTGLHERRRRLRTLLGAGPAFLVPGVTDAMGALLAENAGFGAAYVTGSGLANAQFGVPDIGLLGATDVVAHVDRLTTAAALPLIVDADTGFGGPISAVRAVRALERAGAAAVQIEDQEMPKRCGHFDSHRLIPAEHMQSKIDAVVQAREDPALVVIARTDARSVYDIDEAIRRGKAYAEAGADVLFIEAPRTIDEMARVGTALAGIPLLVNVVEGGKTPELPLSEYEKLGFTVVLYANFLMRVMLRAGQEALAELLRTGESAGMTDRIAAWDTRQGLFRLPEFLSAETHFDRPWQPSAAVA